MEKVQINENTIDLFTHTDITSEGELISRECVDYLNGAINTLLNKCKVAFKLIREDEMKYKDAVDILRILVKTLRARITMVVRELRESLVKEMNG